MTLTFVREAQFALDLTREPRLKSPVKTGISDSCDMHEERMGGKSNVQVGEWATPEMPVTGSALTGSPGAGTSLMIVGNPSVFKLGLNSDRLARLTWRSPHDTRFKGAVR